MKQIITLVKDCRGCPAYCFKERVTGGIVFLCGNITTDSNERLVPCSVGDGHWIHHDCPLEDKEIEYDESGHIKYEHRDVIDTAFSRDFCIRQNSYCDYIECNQWPGHKNKNYGK